VLPAVVAGSNLDLHPTSHLPAICTVADVSSSLIAKQVVIVDFDCHSYIPKSALAFHMLLLH
jgi:hypothetical protein